MGKLDWPVVRTAAAAGLLLIIPAALISSVLVDDDSSSSWVFLFSFIILLGFVVAGFAAGTRRSDTPMMHGAAAALACYLVVQLFGLVRRLASGDEINVFTYPIAALFAAACGVAGAVFADWSRRRALRT